MQTGCLSLCASPLPSHPSLPSGLTAAFIDAGEFIVLKDGVSSLPDLLKRHESHPGLVLHWRFFSFNGHIDRPRQGVLSSYTACCRRKYTPHRTIKSIVQPRLTIGPKTTHNFRYKKGHAVNTAGTRVDETLVSSTEEVSSMVLPSPLLQDLAEEATLNH